MPAFRNNEVVIISDSRQFDNASYGTIVCSLDCQRDDITENDVGAVVLLFADYRTGLDDNGLRDVSIDRMRKQYSNI